MPEPDYAKLADDAERLARRLRVFAVYAIVVLILVAAGIVWVMFRG